MSPPAYADLGSTSRNLFNKYYHYGNVKLELKTKTPTGVEFNVNGTSNNDTSRVAAVLETKYNIKQHGVTLKQRWDTDNVLTGEATAEDYFVTGLKTGLLAKFAPQSGKKTGTLKLGYKSLYLNLNSDVDFDYSGAVFKGSGVFGHVGFLAGMNVTFDPTKNRLNKSEVALGYQAPEFHITGHLDDGREFKCLVYQKLNDQLETGLSVAWASDSNVTNFGLGCHYKLDKYSAVRAKVNNTSQIGISFIHRLRPGFNLTLSTLFDAKDMSPGGHKFGVGIDLAP